MQRSALRIRTFFQLDLKWVKWKIRNVSHERKLIAVTLCLWGIYRTPFCGFYDDLKIDMLIFLWLYFYDRVSIFFINTSVEIINRSGTRNYCYVAKVLKKIFLSAKIIVKWREKINVLWVLNCKEKKILVFFKLLLLKCWLWSTFPLWFPFQIKNQ